MSGVKDTSLMAYIEQVESGRLGKMQEKIYEVIKENPESSNKEIADILGIAINCVTGRTNELVNKFKIVEDAGTKLNDKNRKVHMWRCVKR